MTGSTIAESTPVPAKPALGAILAGLCVTELVSWGLLYYAFPVLAPSISADTGWSPQLVSAGFSLSLMVSAVCGVLVGRHIDRYGPRVLMTVGSLLAAVGVMTIAAAQHPVMFYIGWVVVGAAMAGTLYPPAFAALARWFTGQKQIQAFAALTLVAGLASTVFAPLVTFLDAEVGWRVTYLWAGAGLLAITVPTHWILLRRTWPEETQSGTGSVATNDYVRRVVSTTRFRLLIGGLALTSLAMYAALITLIPLMLERGLSASAAAWVLGIGGAGQVFGRLIYTAVSVRLSLATRTFTVFAFVTAGTAAMAFVSGPLGLLIAFSVIAGIGRGVATLLQATAIPDRWGTKSYGHISGILSMAVLLAMAVGPWAGSFLAEVTGSYENAFLVFTGMASAGTVLMVLSTRPSVPPAI
ncbi:MAG: MFS transporter [Leucobacter sp.]